MRSVVGGFRTALVLAAVAVCTVLLSGPASASQLRGNIAAASPLTITLVGNDVVTDTVPGDFSVLLVNGADGPITVSAWADAGRNPVRLTIPGRLPATHPADFPFEITVAAQSTLLLPATVSVADPVRPGKLGVIVAATVTDAAGVVSVVTASRDFTVSLSTAVLAPGILGVGSALLVPGVLAIFCWLLAPWWDRKRRGYPTDSALAELWTNKSLIILGLVISLVLGYLLSVLDISLWTVGVVDILGSPTLNAIAAVTVLACLLAFAGAAIDIELRRRRIPVITAGSSVDEVLAAATTTGSLTTRETYAVGDDGRIGLLLFRDRGSLVLVPQILYNAKQPVVLQADAHSIKGFVAEWKKDGTRIAAFTAKPVWIDHPVIAQESEAIRKGSDELVLFDPDVQPAVSLGR